MFLRSRSRGRETWGYVVLGVFLCLTSVLGLAGILGEITTSRGSTLVLFGVPLGLLPIGVGVANALRGWSDPGDEEVDDPPHAGDRAALPGEDASRPDGMIDR
ncbi:hypothetical protein [Clavibacter nebraskensis]|uniref:Integral membrane protein n=2 Tax=Clavibacter nebraskensis TaxID=31963 RepID=A0A399PNR9_9MICO|nr:hypothetical protein [Clavibacter nebraskensis]KXU19960.1 hypothetical protein VV38_11325 [Clavibacter nebraskensis]OAH17955.1 hypothetical protein A3Q38_12230 [Clavibacter nebraskensis]QGV67429.1 hypothetical protein EGX36_11715 [Clavibacter nebraskensis]QGV70228.1 hypothetical protein EGX37_11670 [Clavibacter nebraskensis]QGV73019.1 hypothetical protein EGX35_11670 [Clavibacter nebraskensis]